MNITFGICLGEKYNQEYLIKLLHSIYEQNIPTYEVVVIGNIDNPLTSIKDLIPYLPLYHIPFNEGEKPGWITKKKNQLAKAASFDNLCIVHDYLKFSPGWYDGVKAYSKLYNWRVLLNRVETLEGTRSADWLVNPNFMQTVIDTNPDYFTKMLMAVAPHENAPKYVSGLPYGINDLNHIQYISGGFIFCKTMLLRTIPMNEDMIWGDSPGEDVEWSERLNLMNIPFHFNPYSTVTIQKPNKWYLSQMPYKFIEALRNYYGVRGGI